MTAIALPATTDADLCSAVKSGRAAGQMIVERHTALVISIVTSMNLPPTVDRDELIQEGLIALLHAAEKFDGSRGNKFGTYAWTCVSNAVRRTAGKEAARTTSLNAHPMHSESREYLDGLPAPEPPKLPDGLRERVAKLPPMLREVVTLYFGLDGESLTAGEIAARLGLTIPQAKRALEMALNQV